MAQHTSEKINNPFASLKYRNFRYYWIGMCVSLIGTWMQNIAQPWLAYSLTNSPLLLSLVGTLQFLPVLLFSLFAGVMVDRFPKKKLLLLTQSASLVNTLVLTLLVYSGHIQYWHILLMATIQGLINTLDMPARQSFVIQLVEKESLMNAIALNSMSFNIARIIGPSLAGLIMGTMGISVCFLINSLSFGAVIIGLLFVKPIVLPQKNKTSGHVLHEVKEGLVYISKNETVLSTLLLIAVVGTFVPNFSVLVPVFTKEILHLNETYFGLIMSAMGLGSFLGATYVASFSKSGPKNRILYGAPLITACFMLLTGASNHYLWTCLFMIVTGFFFILFSSSANTNIQLHSSNEYRGRVMSVYSLVFAGSTPFGNLYAGFFANDFSARVGFWACGLAILVLMMPLIIRIRKQRLSATSQESKSS